MTQTQKRDANHLRWQESTGFGIHVSWPEYRKMEHKETLWWGCCHKKRENGYVSKRWHPSFKKIRSDLREMNELDDESVLLGVHQIDQATLCSWAGIAHHRATRTADFVQFLVHRSVHLPTATALATLIKMRTTGCFTRNIIFWKFVKNRQSWDKLWKLVISYKTSGHLDPYTCINHHKKWIHILIQSAIM